MNLDIDSLPVTAHFFNRNLADIPLMLQTGIEALQNDGMLRGSESIGIALAKPVSGQLCEWSWDNPYDFTWFVAGWGPEARRFIANAVRKLRPMLRERMDTLQLRIHRPDAFRNAVKSANTKGNFPWGDYPWGGATFVRVGDMVIPVAVSGDLPEVEDDAVAKIIGGFVGAYILKAARPEEFGPNS